MAQVGDLICTGAARFLNTINGKLDWSNILNKPTIPNASTVASSDNSLTVSASAVTGRIDYDVKLTNANALTALGYDGSTTTQCLTKKGTWATFGTSNLALGTTSTTALKGDTKYAGSSSAGGAATSLANFSTTTTTSVGVEITTNVHGYVSGLTKAAWNSQQTDGALYGQFYSASWKHLLYADYRTGHMATRGKNNGTWQDWLIVYDSGNLTSKAAAASGTDVSLVTTGEKATWNAKVSGSGTSGYLTKWNGTSSITNGPALSSAISSQTQSTKFLREDGTWSAPSYTTNTNTTYAIGANGTNVTLTPSSGSVQSITVPYAAKATQDSDGNAINSTYLKLSGGTLTGKLTLSTSGLEVNSAAGYTINQYGDFVHKRDTNTDVWQVLNSTGSSKFSVNYENGNVTAAGSVTATQFNGPATKLTTSTAGDINNPVYFTGGVPTACNFKVVRGDLASNTSKIYNMAYGLVLMWRGQRSTSQCEMVLIQQWDDGTSVNGRVVLRSLTGAGCVVYTTNTSIQLSNNGSNYLQFLLIGNFSS